MSDEVHDVLIRLAERGSPAGASAVVDRALAQVDPTRFADVVLRQPAPRTRQRFVRRVAAIAGAVACLLVAVTVGGALYLRHKVAQIQRVDVTGALSGSTAGGTVGPTNILLIGSDTGVGPDAGGVPGARADAIMILRIDPQTRRSSLLSVPRDLLVTVPGTTQQQRIAGILSGDEHGVAAQVSTLIQAVRDTLGFPVDHYAEITFDGFRRLVSAIGGVTIPFTAPARDPMSGLDIPAAGCVSLDGDQALAYVRSRHYQFFDGQRWQTDPTGDIGRIQRQQQFFGRALARLGDVAKTPAELNRLLDAAAGGVRLDSLFSRRDIERSIAALHGTITSDLTDYTVPTAPATVNGSAVLVLDPGATRSTVAEFLASTGKAPAAPSAPAASEPRC